MERSDECQCYCKGGDGVIRADSKGRAVVAPDCISLSCSRAVLSLSSAANVSGHDRAVWLKSERWVLFGFFFLPVCVLFRATNIEIFISGRLQGSFFLQ